MAVVHVVYRANESPDAMQPDRYCSLYDTQLAYRYTHSVLPTVRQGVVGAAALSPRKVRDRVTDESLNQISQLPKHKRHARLVISWIRGVSSNSETKGDVCIQYTASAMPAM
jgi:hypothetical protein